MLNTVAVDCDGVIVAVHEIIDLLWERKGLPFKHDPHVTDFDYAKCVGSLAKQIAYDVFRRSDLYDDPDLPLEVGALEGVEALRAMQYRVIAVSTPFSEHASSKWRFLNSLGFRNDEIFLTGDKGSVQWDVLIDDRLETALNTGVPRGVLLYDQPWNQTDELPFNVERVRAWEDIPGLLERVW